ncbi:MAG: 3-oxoacyl-ACP reductase FabG [Actinobacteria bacterium]|nr:3-oxoacyl-ACP reductase FabG [Actinomycetota bacterium]
MRFSGKSVIVTGGAKGIGAVYAKAFAAEGANVVVADVLEPEGEALVEEVNGQNGSKALFVPADVTDDQSMSQMARQTADAFGRIDILVNNAAIYFDLGVKKPFDEISLGEWDKVMAVNVRGVWQCTKAVSPYMKQQGYGKIVNISSVVAHVGAAGFAHYVASKSAVIGLTRALARELGTHNVTVNAVAPGLVTNEATRQINVEDYIEQAAKTRSVQRAMSPEDLLGAVLFLSSPDSDFISGQTYIVDGGAVMN